MRCSARNDAARFAALGDWSERGSSNIAIRQSTVSRFHHSLRHHAIHRAELAGWPRDAPPSSEGLCDLARGDNSTLQPVEPWAPSEHVLTKRPLTRPALASKLD